MEITNEQMLKCIFPTRRMCEQPWTLTVVRRMRRFKKKVEPELVEINRSRQALQERLGKKDDQDRIIRDTDGQTIWASEEAKKEADAEWARFMAEKIEIDVEPITEQMLEAPTTGPLPTLSERDFDVLVEIGLIIENPEGGPES